MSFRVLFFGTPAFAVPTLARLLASTHSVVGVVTQPDRPRGRGLHVAASPVKTLAVSHDVPVHQPERLRDDSWLSAVRELSPDIAVVAAYGRLLPQLLLDVTPHGFVNVHASLLPRWRGAAPVHRAIVAGDAQTGVTIMRVVLALDAGPMLSSAATPIGADETSVELEARLADRGAALLVETLDRLGRADIPAQAQDERDVTYAHKLVRADSHLDWTQPAQAIHDRIRGLQPWPLAAATLHGRRVSFRRSAVTKETGEAGSTGAPGQVIAIERDAILVAAGAGAIRLLELQEAGRPAMRARDYLNGRRVATGDMFEALPPGA